MKIKKLLAISLSLITTIAVSGCTNHKAGSIPPDSDVYMPAFIDTLNTDDPKQYASSHEELAVLTDMKPALENDLSALYYSDSYYDIAVLDKRTDKVWFSNRALHFEDEISSFSDESKSEAYSQLRLDFFDVQTRADKMSSYPDAVDGDSLNQVEVSTEDNVFRVEYTVGKRRDQMLIYLAMLPETYDKYVERGQELADSEEIDSRDFNTFCEAYGYFTVDDFSEAEKAEMLRDYPALEKYDEVYYLTSGLSDLQMERVQNVITALGVSKADIDAENKKLGEESVSSEPFFFIPLEYELDGADLIVRIMGEEIEYPEGYMLSRIELLPMMGAVEQSVGGFMFIPDGSGAVIKNDSPGKDMYQISMPFYGADYGLDLSSVSSLSGSAPMPVYAVASKQSGMVAVMENGEADCGITAAVSDVTSYYNRVKLYYDYHKYDTVNYEWENSQTHLLFSKTPSATKISVRYHFVYGEDVSYNDVAGYYQSYLMKTGVLSETTDEPSINLDIIGSTYEYKQFLGFPKRTVLPLTTFSEAEDILSKLKSGGVDSVYAGYTSCFTGGSEYPIPAGVSALSELGGKKDFSSLLGASKKLGYKIFPQIDFVSAYKDGNGYSSARDAVRFISKKAGVAAEYNLVTGQREAENQRQLISPFSYEWIAKEFISGIRGTGMDGVSLMYSDRLGANYHESSFADRETAKDLFVSLTSNLKEAELDLMVQGGNKYTLKNAGYISSIPTDSSHFRIESQQVPFVGMVLRGCKSFSGAVINNSSDIDQMILQSAESGADLHFSIMSASNESIKNAVGVSISPVSREVWLDSIITAYQKYSEVFAPLSGQRIKEHRELAAGVKRITYQNGDAVYVNYNDSEISVDGITVKSKDYTVKGAAR